MTEAPYIAFSANILHCRQGDKGDGREVLQFSIVDGMPHIKEFHLERKADVAIVFGIISETPLNKRIPVIFTIVDDECDYGNILLPFQEKVVVIFRNLEEYVILVGGLVFGDDSYVKPRDAASLNISLKYKVSGAGMLVAGEILLRAAKRLEIDGVEKRLKRGIVTREQRQEFRHTTGFRKGITQEPIMGEVALAILHGINDDVKFVGDVANDGIRRIRLHAKISIRTRCIVFNIFVFRH